MNIKNILSAVAPFLSSMIGGPFGLAAERIIAKTLVGDENASEDTIKQALATAKPEELVELKKIDAEYKGRMAELAVEKLEIAREDRKNARNREIQLKDRIPAILSILITLGFFGILLMIMLYPIHTEQASVIDIMLGALGTAWISCVTYYFGSSYGSQLKTQLMAKN